MSSPFDISPATLRQQAQAAREAGFTQLGDNLRRAAELAAVPNEDLLKMYELLRPGRSTEDELLEMARRLDSEFAAPETAAFVREAAGVYKDRGLFRKT